MAGIIIKITAFIAGMVGKDGGRDRAALHAEPGYDRKRDCG
jgi:hypothetical protein